MPDPTLEGDVPRFRFAIGLRRFLANHSALCGLAVLVALVLVAWLGPLAWRYDYAEITRELSQPPSWLHPLGTDTLSRDMLALVMRGLQQSFRIAISVALVSCLIGTVLGIVAGYLGGAVDTGLMRLVDLVLTIPTIALAAFLGNALSHQGVSWLGLSLVLGALFWTSVARLVRGVTLGQRELAYIKAAQVMGAGPIRIMLRHLAPNVADHVIVATALLVAVAILAEAGLSFLGFGIRPPDTSLGLLIANAQSAVLTRPWMFYAPGLAIILVVLSVNYVGEGLRDAFNPKATRGNPLISPRTWPWRKRPPADRSSGHLVVIENLTIRFPRSSQPAVSNLHLHIDRGEVLALVGESGSGKSLTALALAGLLPSGAERSGRTLFDGVDTTDLTFRQWRAYRGRRIAVILQDPSTSLNPVLTIGEHFVESFAVAGPIGRSESHRRAVNLMSQLGIRHPESRLAQYPHQMSGGIRQRIVIAMAMIHSPDLIIADEPTTALDVTVQAQVLDALRVACTATGAAMLFITHDLAVVAGLADRVAVMRNGRIVEDQNVFSLFDKPHDPYTKRLLDLAPRLENSARVDPALKESDARLAHPLLRIKNLTKDFKPSSSLWRRNDGRTARALDNVSFDLAAGETLGIVGESGSGKTTLLSVILGLYAPSSGHVIFDGVDMTADSTQRRAMRQAMGVVFQDPYTSLDPRMTVAQLLAEPAQIHRQMDRMAARRANVLDRVKLPKGGLDRFPHEFSGGQRQRIAIARALMLSPRLIVLDEPVSALDVSIQQDILVLLKELQSDSGVAFLLVAHDLAVVAELAHQIGVMQAGQLVEQGPTSQIIGTPRHPFTRDLIEAVPIPDPSAERRRQAQRAGL